jgi:hypothetical protein
MPDPNVNRPKGPERVHQRPPDPAEAADRPLEPKESADVHWPSEPPKDPHHALNNPVDEPDPTADSDPYEAEIEPDGEPPQQEDPGSG